MASSSSALIVGAIDFGTSNSGWAFSFRHDYKSDPTKIHVKNWNSGSGISQKTPTVALIKPDGKTLEAFGYDAENKFKDLVEENEQEGYYYFRRFKMTLNKKLDEKISRHSTIEDDFEKPLSAMTVFSSSIKFLRDDLIDVANKQIGSILSQDDIKWVLTVPAIWTDSAKQFMREAATEAGIDTDKLTIALEPEAASIYCRHLSVDRTVDEQNVSISQFAPGTKYMILDAGGMFIDVNTCGTVDITVHETLQGDGLREVHAASGGGWGGILVDEAFKTFLIDIVGEQVYRIFAHENQDDWIDLWREFETKKMIIDPKTNSNVYMRFPPSITTILKSQESNVHLWYRLLMSYLFQRFKKQEPLSDSISKSKFSKDVTFVRDKIKLHANLVKSFFDSSVQKTVSHVKTIMEHPKVKDIKAILMVGGFSDSPILQNAVREACPGVTVIIPIDAVSTILKGAVIFGHNPEAITERVLKHTYGLGCSNVFVEGKHPESKKYFVQDRGYCCSDLFDKHVEIFQSIVVGSRLPRQTYNPRNKNAKSMLFPIYASELHNPKFTDRGCTKIGNISIELPNHDGDLSREVYVSFAFGGTEIEVTGEDERSDEKTNVTIDYLG